MYDVENIKALNNFYLEHITNPFEAQFLDAIKDYTDKKPGEISEVQSVKSIIDQKLEQLNTLNSLIDKISPIIGSSRARDLKVAINSCRESVELIGSNFDKFADNMSDENWAEFLKAFNDNYLTNSESLGKAVEQTAEDYYASIVDATQNNNMTEEDLEELLDTDLITEGQKEEIRNSWKQIKEQAEQEKANGNGNEEETDKKEDEELQTQPEEKKGETLESQEGLVQSENAEVAEPVKKSLDELLNGVRYTQGEVYSNAISKVRIQYEIDQLEERKNALLEQYKNKKKLSFKEAVALQQIVNQQESLNEMMFNLESAELSRKEQKTEDNLSNTAKQANERVADIQLEQLRREEMQSRLFKYISTRKEQKLQNRLEVLRTKMATMTMQQRRAALVKFDKLNNKLVHQAYVSAKKQVHQQRRDERKAKRQQMYEDLVELKNRVVNEAKAIGRDADRYIFHPVAERCAQLRGQEIVLLAPPVQVELIEAEELEEANVMAA